MRRSMWCNNNNSNSGDDGDVGDSSGVVVLVVMAVWSPDLDNRNGHRSEYVGRLFHLDTCGVVVVHL